MNNSEDQAAETAKNLEPDAKPALDANPVPKQAGKCKQPRKDQLEQCKACDRWDEIKERARVSLLVRSAVDEYEAKLNANGFKPTLAEYIKLLQLEKEIEDGVQDKEVVAKWVSQETELQPAK